MDLWFFILIGITTVFPRGEGSALSLSTGANQVSGLKTRHQLDTLSVRPLAEPVNPARHRGRDAARPTSARPHRRPRRCTCYSYKDKECVYYCHLDIIWINTPERIVTYGVSSYRGQPRTRRSSKAEASGQGGAWSQRCTCSDRADLNCSRFCRERILEPRVTFLLGRTPIGQDSHQALPPSSTTSG